MAWDCRPGTAAAFCHLHRLFSLKSELYSSCRGFLSVWDRAARRTGGWGGAQREAKGAPLTHWSGPLCRCSRPQEGRPRRARGRALCGPAQVRDQFLRASSAPSHAAFGDKRTLPSLPPLTPRHKRGAEPPLLGSPGSCRSAPHGSGVRCFPQEPSRGSERPRLPAVDTGPSSPVRGASRLWNPHPPAPCSGSVLPTPACLVPPHRRNFQPHCQVGCLILDGHLGDLTAHP